MDIKKFIEEKGEYFTWTDFSKWLADEGGLDNIKKSDLDLFVEKLGMKIIVFAEFTFLYNIVSTRENNEMIEKTNSTMLKLTKITAAASIIAIIVSVATLIVA